jgi:hypothetical protein
MPFIVLSLMIQVAFIVHIMKTGRSTIWIWIVVLLPGAGSIAYVIIEILPELMESRAVRRASRSMEKIINPNKEINAAAQEYSISNTIDKSLKLADECMSKGMHEEAKQLYEKSLVGIHEDDPEIMFGLAKAEYSLDNFAESKHILKQLIQKNPDYKNQEAHLLFAKTVEALGEVSQAVEEYEVLAGYYTGAEAKYRYALLLQQQGHNDKAYALLAEIVNLSKLAGKRFQSLNKKWITLAKKELGSQ